MKTRICFVAGTKGGVGKTFAACQMVAAAEELGLSITAFDSDTENSTLKSMLPGQAEFLDDTNDDYPLDEVISAACQETPSDLILVDMKAGTSRSTMDWFAAVPWEDLLRKAEICILCSVTVDPDASRTLSPWLVYFDGLHVPVEYIIIRNAKDGKDFSFYTGIIPQSLADLKLAKHSEIEFPAMDKNYVSILNNARLTLKAAVTTGRERTRLNTVMAQARLLNFYHAFSDPLITLMAQWIPQEEQTESRKQVISQAQKRIRLRNALQLNK